MAAQPRKPAGRGEVSCLKEEAGGRRSAENGIWYVSRGGGWESLATLLDHEKIQCILPANETNIGQLMADKNETLDGQSK